MTKRKSVVSKILLLVVLLTLVSCCFLGSTFARYTSGGSGSATLTVAKWDVSHGEGDIALEFEKLSPAMEVYGSTDRTNVTGKILVATITNKGDVDAEVSVVADNIKITKIDGASYASEPDGIATAENPTEAEVKEVFSIKLYKGTSADEEKTANLAVLGAKETVSASTGVLYIYAEVTWTSDTDSIKGETADKRDTWIGENVTSVSYDISYTAVQNTELPNA